jgi:hypothetical protein
MNKINDIRSNRTDTAQQQTTRTLNAGTVDTNWIVCIH